MSVTRLITWYSRFVLSLVVGCQAYNGSYRNLTAVPGDISTTDTEITLQGNLITSLDTFPVFPSLLGLDLAENLLATFPNVCSVGSTLQTLSLQKNMISDIDASRLDCLVMLQHLSVASNPLAS
jgi:Leucine-rich repeat (LRR) protein